MPRISLAGRGRRCAGCSRLIRGEAGQALPLVMALMLALLAGGVIVLWIALATADETTAQTAADAAALAAEHNVVEQLQQPWSFVNGQWVPPQIDWSAARHQADLYAGDNQGQVIAFEPDTQTEPWGAPDVTVVVASLSGLPARTPGGAKQAVAAARASTDPLSVSTPPNPVSNDASLSTTVRYTPPTQKDGPGFFPNPGTDYNQGQESSIAGTLNDFAIKHKLHLIGLMGYVAAKSAGDTSLHTCGAVSSTEGIPNSGPKKVTDQALQTAGLERLFPARQGQPDEIALAGTTRATCALGASTTPPSPQSTPVLGNSDVHLVDLNGGPTDPGLAFPFGGVSAIGGPWVIPTPIVMCESGGRNLPPNSAGASGYYQIIVSTWLGFGGGQYAPQAYKAPKAIQDLIAARIWNGGAGWANWDCAKMVQWHA